MATTASSDRLPQIVHFDSTVINDQPGEVIDFTAANPYAGDGLVNRLAAAGIPVPGHSGSIPTAWLGNWATLDSL